MTDIPNRRRQDAKLDEILKAQSDSLTNHVNEYHVASKEEIIRRIGIQDELVESMKQGTADVAKLTKDTAVIRLAMEGVPEHNANGVVIGHIGGMRNDIADLTHLANGGGGFAVKRRDKWHVALTVLGASLITASGFVVSAWIG